MKSAIWDDLYRVTGNNSKIKLIQMWIEQKWFRNLCFYRGYHESKNVLTKTINKFGWKYLCRNSGLEIPLTVKCGKGLMCIHPIGITFNSRTVVGKNCTILKGATLGNVKGPQGGAPEIGDNVYIGLHASVVGKVKIGNNVLIAANTFVNFDVPSDSVVIGNPGVIHPKKNASKDYISNPVE